MLPGNKLRIFSASATSRSKVMVMPSSDKPGSPAPAYDRTASVRSCCRRDRLIDTDNIEQVHGEGDQVGIASCSSMLSASAWAFSPPLEWFPAGGHDLVPAVLSALHVARAVFDQIVKAFGLIR